jgi:hypothetical protein
MYMVPWLDPGSVLKVGAGRSVPKTPGIYTARPEDVTEVW